MNIQRLSLLLITLVFLLFFIPKNISAHPGRTASDGCHYCRTNCDKWGVAWNQRHCHGGYSPPSTYTVPIATALPISTPTPRPTSTPAPTPDERSIPIGTPTLSPEVRGEGTEDIQSAEERDSGSGMLLPLGALGLVGGYWFYKKRIKKNKKEGG